MPSFKDSEGNEYRLKLTIGLAKKIKEITGIDLAGDYEAAFRKLHEDPYAFCNVLFHMVGDQFKGDEEAFANVLDGDVLEAARPAVVDAVIDFFPSQKRAILKTINQKGMELDKRITEKAMTKIDSQCDQIEAKLQEMSGEQFTMFLDGLGSTKNPTPSEN